MDDTTNRFFSPAHMIRPSVVADPEWQNRRMLPSVHTNGNCNIALLSILRLSGQYTWAVSSFAHVSGTELLPSATRGRSTVFHECVVKYGFGGFRQVPGSPALIAVLYADGSFFERFLLSGLGSRHYDAARENADGTITVFWLEPDGRRSGN
ncbi:MAG: hypothetical protein Q9202_007612, partial [Teloschistes flavicans]